MDDFLWKDQTQEMVCKFILRLMFAIWAIAVAALSVISYPGSKDLLVFVKLTSSGFVVHGIAYFVGILLCYLAFEKKNISFVLWTGLLIFLFSVVLEVVQFYLPYRTFNVYDVVANWVGVLLFGVWMLFISHRHTRMDTDFFELATDPPQYDLPEATGQAGQAEPQRSDGRKG